MEGDSPKATASSGRDEQGDAIFAVMRRRRMHRSFDDRVVEPDRLAALVWAAARAPTARPGVRQFVLVTAPGLMRTLRQVCPGFINDAPAAVVVCSDLEQAERAVGARGREVIARIDAGAAAGYMSLAAPALGLGICLVTSWSEAAVQEVFELPPSVRPEVIVAVGYPVAHPPKAAKAAPPIVFSNRYGLPWEEDAWTRIRSSSSPSISSRRLV
jgi:nitroreductase